MGLFKKKKEKNVGCCCGSCGSDVQAKEGTTNAYVKVLGMGCKKCKQLEENALEALRILGKDEVVGHVTDMAEIASYGVMSTPALVVNEKVVSFGKVLSSEEIVELLK